MTPPIIQRLDVESYGCIKKLSLPLTPLHALIGPNDSGKSTILRALRTAAQFAVGTFPGPGKSDPFDPMIAVTGSAPTFTLHVAEDLAYRVRTDSQVSEEIVAGGQVVPGSLRRREWHEVGIVTQLASRAGEPEAYATKLAAHISLPTMIRFDPDFLRAPAALIPESKGIALADERGSGLASVFDALLNRDAEAFAEIQRELCSRFPSVAKLGLINVSNATKEMAITLTDGSRVGAKGMSEGLLYYLGFAALRHLTGSRLFLVEEPENGLHPSRIADVVRGLREMSKTAQVLIATHSPLVVNELRGDEISVVTRPPALGTQTVLLKDVPGFEEASKVYLPGELWVSYADGNAEEPLLTGKPRS